MEAIYLLGCLIARSRDKQKDVNMEFIDLKKLTAECLEKSCGRHWRRKLLNTCVKQKCVL